MGDFEIVSISALRHRKHLLDIWSPVTDKEDQAGDSDVEVISPPTTAMSPPVHKDPRILQPAVIEPELPDPVISILITSSIPDTAPLIVHRKMSQRLKEVRVAWCQKQGFDAATTSTVFLTWRKRRLFDFTTCKGLGLGVDSNGEVYIEGHADQAHGDENAQLHMEATTQGILEAEKKAAAQPQREQIDKYASPKGKSSGPPGIKVILRGKGYEDYKLLVRPVRVRRDLILRTKLTELSNSILRLDRSWTCFGR